MDLGLCTTRTVLKRVEETLSAELDRRSPVRQAQPSAVLTPQALSAPEVFLHLSCQQMPHAGIIVGEFLGHLCDPLA